MFTITMMLALAAFVSAILGAMGKAPLYVAVLLLSILALVEHLPL